MNVYIVRHGQVLHNALKVYSNEDEDLTEKGIDQAKQLKNEIQNLEYDVIICSPLLRARHTAEIINVKNRDILFDNRLKERNPGNLNGKPISYTNREEYWNFNSNIQYGTSENMKTFLKEYLHF